MDVEDLTWSEAEMIAAEALLLMSRADEYGLDDDDDKVGLTSRTTFRKRDAATFSSTEVDGSNQSKFSAGSDWYASDEFGEMFKLSLKKRRSVAWFPVVNNAEDDNRLIIKKLSLHLLEKKKKNPSASAICKNKIKIKNKNMKKAKDDVHMPQPDMPENMKAVVESKGGTGVILVIQKRLFPTDVTRHNNRLQIPCSKIPKDSLGFLLEDEQDLLATREQNNHLKHIETSLLDPRLVWHNIKLRKWDMSKKVSGAPNEVYALCSPWIDIVKANGLKEGDLVQVWAFRVGDNKLHLALVLIDETNLPAA